MGSVGAILLAAGLGQRMGRIKALMSWQGLPLITYQAKTLRRAGLRPVLAVIGYAADVVSPRVNNEYGVTPLINPFYKKGKTTSLKTGLRALNPKDTDSVLILNVDQPRTQETIETIIDHHNRDSALITIPTFKGKRGHPVVVSLRLMGDLMAVSEARQGLKGVMRKYHSEISQIEMDTDEILLDLNTPEDYETALQAHAQP